MTLFGSTGRSDLIFSSRKSPTGSSSHSLYVLLLQADEDEAWGGVDRQAGQYRGHQGKLGRPGASSGDKSSDHLALSDHAKGQLV